MIRVTINCAKDFLKERSQMVQLCEDAVADRNGVGADAYLDLYDAIEQLRPEYREVIKLYYLDDLPVKLIAQVLDKNENTIKTQLSRAREILRSFLET